MEKSATSDFQDTYNSGCAIAHAISSRLSNMAAQARSQVKSCGICGGQSGTEACFLQVLWFPLPIFIPPNAPYSYIIRGWYHRPISGWHTKWTQVWHHPMKLVYIHFWCRNLRLRNKTISETQVGRNVFRFSVTNAEFNLLTTVSYICHKRWCSEYFGIQLQTCIWNMLNLQLVYEHNLTTTG
jgi:hypothetical protein